MTGRPQIRIYLDLDGVLADFETHLHTEGKAKPDGSPKWDELVYDWWVGIPVFDGAPAFYQETKKMAEVFFLTAPVPIQDCFAGKSYWLSNVFTKDRFTLNSLIICPGVTKQFFARPHHILVDDRIKNIDEWVAAGGIGIHHTGDFEDTMRQVKEAVEKLGGPMPKVFKKKAPQPNAFKPK